jgi:hypothetical protein
MEPQVTGAITATVQTAGDDDRVTSYGWKALAGSVIGYSMDGFDPRPQRQGAVVAGDIVPE